jgi:uncharacterized protein (UPF0332 family)
VGQIAVFGLEYVVNDNFDKKINKILSQLEDDREDSDYYSYSYFTEEDALYNLEKAEIFVEECKKFL